MTRTLQDRAKSASLTRSSISALFALGVTLRPFFASTVASPTPHPYLW